MKIGTTELVYRGDPEEVAFDLPPVLFEDKMVNLFKDMVGENKKNQKLLSVGLMATAGLLLTLGNSLVQYVYKINHEAHISSFQVLFVRSVIQAFFTVLFMIRGKVHPYGDKPRNLIILIIMGIIEAAAIVLIYLSLEKIPVGDATVIQFTSPMFTMLFSFIILRTCCSWIEAIFGILSFSGVVFIAKPSIIEGKKNALFYHHAHHINTNSTIMHTANSPDYVFGTTFALLGAMCLAMFYILNKVNGKKTDVTLTIFYPSIVGIIMSPIVMAIRKEAWAVTNMKPEVWGILVVVGFVSFIGLMFMAEALQLENPGPAVLIRNLDVIYAFLLQYVLMHRPPGLSSLVGTIIILTCSAIIVLSRVFSLDRLICGNKGKCGNDNDNEKEAKDFLLTNTGEDNTE